MRPQWSRWAWVSSSASTDAGSKANGSRLRLDLLGRALEHAAVDEDASLADGDEELRAGDGADRPQELDGSMLMDR